MENRNSSPDLANMSQDYTVDHLGPATLSAIENWELLVASLQSINPEQGITVDLVNRFNTYLDSINETVHWYSANPSRFTHVKRFFQQTFQNLYATKQRLLALDQEDLFYESLSRIGIGVAAFNKTDFENVFLDKIKASRQSQTDISAIQNNQNGFSKEITNSSGLYRKVEDPNTGGLKDISDLNGQPSGNPFSELFQEEPTNPERFDAEVTVVQRAPVSNGHAKVNTILGLGDQENPQSKARVRRRAASRRAITFQGLGALNPALTPEPAVDQHDRPTPIQPIPPITAPSPGPSTIQESLEQAIKVVGRTVTRTFPAVQIEEPIKASSGLPKDSQATRHDIPTEELLQAAGLDKSKIDLDEPTTVDTKSEIPAEAPVSRNSLIISNSQPSFADHLNDIELPVQKVATNPPESKVIFDPNRISQPNLEAPTSLPSRDSSASHLPFAPTLLDSKELNHPPLVPPTTPKARHNEQINRPPIQPAIHLTNPTANHRSPEIDQETRDFINGLKKPTDILHALPSGHFDHPTVQTPPKKGFFASLKSGWNSTTTFIKEKYQSARNYISSGLDNLGNGLKKGLKYAAAGVAALALVGGLSSIFKKDTAEQRHTDQTNLDAQPKSPVSRTEKSTPVNPPIQAPSPDLQKSTSAENISYKVDLNNSAFQAYVGRLDKLKVSGISNMIKEVAPQVQLRLADTPDLRNKYDQAGIDYLNGQETAEQQREAIFQEFLNTALEAKYSNSGVNNFLKIHQKIFKLHLKEGVWKPEWRETKQFFDAFTEPLKQIKDPAVLGYKPNPNLTENPALQGIKNAVPGFYKFYQEALVEMDREPAEYNDYNSIATQTCKKIRKAIDGYTGNPQAKSGASSVQKAWCDDPNRDGIFRESLRKTIPVTRNTSTGSTTPIKYPAPKATPAKPKHTYYQGKQRSINKTAQLKNPTSKPATLRNSVDLEMQIPKYTWKEILKGYFWG